MLIDFYKSSVEKVIENKLLAYAQIPIVPFYSFDYDLEIVDHLVTMEVDEKSVIGGYYPFYRHRDLETFKKLLDN